MSLIHIGLHEAGTAILQNIWQKQPAIKLQHHALNPLISAFNTSVEKKRSFIDFDIQALISPLQDKNKFNIYSNEGLSSYLFDSQCKQEDVSWFRQLSAYYMHQIAPEAHILILCREPMDWIKAIHKQAIIQGGQRSFQNYLLAEQDFISSSLSLRELVTTWGQYYADEKIILLPYEMLVNDRQRFFKELAEQTSSKKLAYDFQLPQQENELNDDELNLLLQTNRLLNLLSDNAEFTQLSIKEFSKDIQNAVHLELKNKNKLSRLASKLSSVSSTHHLKTLEEKGHIKLPESMASDIFNDNLMFLEQVLGDFYGYLQGYADKLIETTGV